MENIIRISPLNPLNFVEKNKEANPLYATRYIDDYQIDDQVLPFQQPVRFSQPWVTGDAIPLQLESNYDPITLTIYDKDDTPVYAESLLFKLRNKYDADMRIYETLIPLTDLEPGEYRIELTFGDPVQKTLESNRFAIVTSVEETVLLEYQHSSYHEGVIFETGIKFRFRVPGYVVDGNTGTKDVMYEDQVQNQTLLSSKSFKTFRLDLGGPTGVPQWFGDLIALIMGCNTVSADGKLIAKVDGAKLDKKGEDGYPLFAFGMDVREAIRRTAKVFSSTGDVSKKLLVVYDTESKGLGGNTVVPILDLE